MDRKDTEHILNWYLSLEERVLEFSKYIPYNDNNKSVELPLLISVLLESGSLIDTIFREEYDNPPKKKNELNIVDYAPYYEEKYEFAERKTLLLKYPPSYFKPFENWVDTDKNYSPLTWWQNHNKIKHNRIENVNLSTLGLAFEMLSAIHQIVSLIPSFVDSLFSHDLVAYNALGMDAVKRHYFRCEKTKVQTNSVLVQSSLFVTPVGGYRFHDDPKDIDFDSIVDSGKLRRFLGTNINV